MSSPVALDAFINLYGVDKFNRLMEVCAPLSQDVFVSRLYREIEEMVEALESARKERKDDSEDRLSSEIVLNLRARGYSAFKDPTQGGHVDIYVRAKDQDKFTWYAEAKIWNGPVYVEGGLGQLLQRYATGRHPDLGLFIYFKDRGIVNKLRDWSAHLELNRLEGLDKIYPVNDFCFDSTHFHASGADIKIRHFGVNVFWRPE